MIYDSIFELIGNTPLLKLNKIASAYNIYAKLEYLNPGGSIKDRIVYHMIEKAEREGKLKPGATIIEPTSGNTGIGLALVAAVKGYKSVIVMPESMSEERKKLLQAYGAELILTAEDKGMKGAIEKAEELVKNNSSYYMLSQFNNPANPETHEKTTARELLADLERIDVLVVGVGTGGTLSGTAKYLKEKLPGIKICAVEPEKSAVLSGKKPGSHMIQGIGAGFVPDVCATEIIDEVLTVSAREAFIMCRKLVLEEGLMVGISAGANVKAALTVARNSGKNINIVTFLPDSGERYLSMYDKFEK